MSERGDLAESLLERVPVARLVARRLHLAEHEAHQRARADDEDDGDEVA